MRVRNCRTKQQRWLQAEVICSHMLRSANQVAAPDDAWRPAEEGTAHQQYRKVVEVA